MNGEASESGSGNFRVWWPWSVAVFFLLWQVDFQFAYSFFADSIQQEFRLTAFETASISLAYLLAYGLMQLPAGLLLDRFGARQVLPIAAGFSALSVFLFSEAQGFWTLLGTRILAGAFMAFVFPGAGKIARNRLPTHRFALAMALADMCFGIGAISAVFIPTLFADTPWRLLMQGQALLGLGLGALLWMTLFFTKPDRAPPREAGRIKRNLMDSLKRPLVRQGIGLYVWGAGLTFGFGGYWNVKLQEACGCTAAEISKLEMGLFSGLAMGMLVAGILGGRVERLRGILRTSTTLTLVLIAVTLWASTTASTDQLLVLMVALGLLIGTCSLSFAVAGLGLPAGQAATVVAIVNAGGCLSGALLQALPIWLGEGNASFSTVSITYLGIAVFGAWTAWRLPHLKNPSEPA
ncbi:MAG: MFS transporter [Halioglobus sp.]|nr:MFS transporter [Halioglobus sp.]